MDCIKCGAKTVSVVGATSTSVTLYCETCGRRTELGKMTIGQKESEVYKRSCAIRKGEWFIIEAKGALISKGVIVAGDMISIGLTYGGAILDFFAGATDGKNVGLLRILMR